MKNNKRYIIFILVLIIFLFGLSVGLVLFVKDLTGAPEREVSAGSVVMVSDSDIIEITNRLSVPNEFGEKISDSNGGTFGYMEFSIVNRSSTSQKYEIYVTRNDMVDTEINSGYVRFLLSSPTVSYLNSDSVADIPTYDNLPAMVDKPASRLLYSSEIGPNSTSKFTLRVWLSDNYVVPLEEDKISFNISARAI